MQPIEINAGAWYLRALRADDRVDDRAALLTGATDAATRRYAGGLVIADLAAADAHVRRRAEQWERDEWYAWAVCEPSTGAMVGEVGLRDVDLERERAELTCWTLPAHRRRGVMVAAVPAVTRWAFTTADLGGLGLHRVQWLHATSNTASADLAARCGFTREGVLRAAAMVDGTREDLVLLSRLATD